MSTEKLKMQVNTWQNNSNNNEEAENFLDPKVLYKFCIALLDVTEIYT